MEQVKSIIEQNLKNPDVFFVFPTDISAVYWAEWALELEEAVALERFTAWDRFKTESIRSMQQEKNSIPSPLRKLFARSLLERNKENAIFTSLINPTYAQTSASFTDWLTSLLPQLASWKEKFLATNGSAGQQDAEDADLLRLEAEYSKFLDANNLFDPAWEKPPFYDDGKTFYIIYPEVLQDFLEYKEILSNTEHIRLVHAPTPTQPPPATTYSNTRTELHETALFLRNLCTPKAEGGEGLNWTDIALSVPDIQTLEPYLLREFSLYNIPVQLRSGKKLGEYPAGRLFSLIRACSTEKFSFDSVRNLLLDAVFPWNDSVAIDQLIQFGIKHNCLCSYDDLDGKGKNDVWEEAFNNKNASREVRAHHLYTSLKKHVEVLCNAKTFEHVKTHYFAFRETFFDLSNFTPSADRIISRCIVELSGLIDLEQTYKDATICADPFGFFIEQLDGKDYLAQNDSRGVNIFPYKLASSAPFKQHIVLDASQSALTITHKRLDFLRDDKRVALGLTDTDAESDVSKFFIGLYASHSGKMVRFTSSTKTFSGYVIPHNSLASLEFEVKKTTEKESQEDFFKSEILLFKPPQDTKLPCIHSIQKEGFSHWLPAQNPTTDVALTSHTSPLVAELRQRIDAAVRDKETGKIRISPSRLNDFYKCPVQWLYSNVLKIEEYSLEASLVDDTSLGLFYHEVISRVLKNIQATTDGILYLNEEWLKDRYKLIAQYTHDVLNDLPKVLKKDLSPLTIELFKMNEDSYVQKLTDFFTEFCTWFEGSKVLSVEEGFASPIPLSDWELQGTIDCVLDYPGNDVCEEGVFIVDFKTATIPTNAMCVKKENEVLQNFQLSSYIRLYENARYEGKPTVQGVAFFSIHGKKPSCIMGVLKTNPNPKSRINPTYLDQRLSRTGENERGFSFEPTMDALDTAIEGFYEAISDKDLSIFTTAGKWGHFPDGTKVPYDTCSACNYKKICRTTYAISGEPL